MEFGAGVVNSSHLVFLYGFRGPEFPIFHDKDDLLLPDTESAFFT